MASALGERAVSWSKETGDNTKDKDKETEKDGITKLPAPPSHPSAPHPHAELPISRINAQEPPPLPKRDVVHSMATTDTVVLPSGVQDAVDDPEAKAPAARANGHVDLDNTDVNAPDSSPVDEITFATPSFEAFPPPSATSHPVATELSVPHIQDPLPPPSPHTVPLPMTPTTPNPISRVTSPILRSRSRLSSPASPPPSSRPASPAVGRSHAGSPAPSAIARATSPSLGHAPSASHIRGKAPMSLGMASSRPASPVPATGPGAPPLPRRAAARRAVPPPPTSVTLKVAEEGGRVDRVSPVATATAVDPVPEADADARKASDAEVLVETKSSDGEGKREREAGADVVKEVDGSQVASLSISTTDANPGPAKDVTVDDTNTAYVDVEGGVNGTSAIVVPDPLPPRASEGDGRTSMDTTSTKRSSSTEGEGFASDATWEERTWKELVKLKEDMFWARIGGRALQG